MKNREKGALAVLRDPTEETAYRRETASPVIEQNSAVWEIPLREVTSLESEYSALTLRLGRLHPDMEACGEPLY